MAQGMTVFVTMATVSTALMIRAVLRMLGTRFLHPVDLAILSTWYYTVPLAVYGFFMYNPRKMIFLHAAAADPSVAAQSMQFGLIAILALVGGQLLGMAMGAPRLTTYFRADQNGEMRARIAFILLIAMVLLGIFQFGVDQFLQGYATESDLQGATLGMALVYFAVGSFGLVIAYALLLHRTTGRRSLLLLMTLSILCALAVLLIRAKRLEIVTTLLPAVIVLLASRASVKVTASRIALGVLAITGLMTVSILRVGDEIDLFTINFYFLSEGLYAGHSLPGLIARLNTGMISYEQGARFLNAILGFVPRFIWPQKDDVVYAGNLAMDGVSPLGATSILTEIVLQGGIAAVVLCYGIMGLMFERSSRFVMVWDRSLTAGALPGRFIAYLVFTTIFIPHFRDGIIPAVKLTLQAGAFMVILVGLHRVPHWLETRSRRQTGGAASA